MSNVLAYLHMSQARRLILMMTATGLGAFMIWVALAHPPANPAWLVFLLLAGGAFLWLAVTIYGTRSWRLELTREELRDQEGRVLVRVDDIEAIDAGIFAFKPPSGFRLRLKAPAKASWQPGLWWCFGRNLGIGGMTIGREAKYMAEVITAMLEQRKG